jgi:hypothetical protein
MSRVFTEIIMDKSQPASTKIALAYPTVSSSNRTLFVEIRRDRDPHRDGQFLLSEIQGGIARRYERAPTREAAIALARDWGYGYLVDAVDQMSRSEITTITVTTSLLVPQESRSIDARDFCVELRDSDRVIATGVITLLDLGNGSHEPAIGSRVGDHWIRDENLRAAIDALPPAQRAWVIAVMACGDVGVSIASFSQVSS